jgi:hypothetical protein
MSKNRQQLKTGLRAILGGGLREEPAAPENPESEKTPDTVAFEPEPTRTLIAIVEPPPQDTRVLIVSPPDVEEEEADEAPAIVAPPEEPARKSRKKPPAPSPPPLPPPLPPPAPPEAKPNMALSVRVGTLENPYVRKRDNLPTRKVGIVLPVALAERMQIHCVKARTRPNEFVARAIEALLDELQA